MSKVCSKCGKEKELTEFYRLKNSRDGRRPDCIGCHKETKLRLRRENPVRDKCNRMAIGILSRTKYKVDSNKNKSYKEKQITCTIGENQKEISDYLYENFYKSIENYLLHDIEPSVDRINSNKGYSPDNIRIIPLQDNIMLGVANAVKKTSKPVKAIHKDMGVKEFPSVTAAAKGIGIKRDTIYAHLDKGTVTRKGYKFESIK